LPIPRAPPVIAHGQLRNSIQPARQVPAIELRQLPPHDDENFLRQIFGLGRWRAQRVQPPHDVVEPCLVDLAKLGVAPRVGAHGRLFMCLSR